MKYLKTYEALKDFYSAGETKYMIVTEDEEFYTCHDFEFYDETDYGYIVLKPTSKLKSIDTSLLYDTEEGGIDYLMEKRQVVKKKQFKPPLKKEAIDTHRHNMIDYIIWEYENDDDPKYSADDLSEMSDDEIKEIFIKDIVNDPNSDWTAGEAESEGYIYIEKLQLKKIPVEVGISITGKDSEFGL
jgi:hypothetical protein